MIALKATEEPRLTRDSRIPIRQDRPTALVGIWNLAQKGFRGELLALYLIIALHKSL